MAIILKKAASTAVYYAPAPAPPPLPPPPKTLADVRDRLAALTTGGMQETRLQLSAINTVAKASGCAPHDLPADPALLRRHLATISPAMAGLTKSSWSSVRSRVLHALRRADVTVMAARRVKALAPEWEALYRALPRNGWRAGLGRFIGFLSDRGVAPAKVCDPVVDRFALELETTSLRGRPVAIVRGAIRGWNAAADAVPGWPPQRLTLREAEQQGYVLPAQNFTPSFQASLTGYLAYLADPPELDDAPFKPLRPVTLAFRAFQFRQMASALVHRGVPIGEITDLRDLTRREHVDRICEFFTERTRTRECLQLQGLLQVLKPIALRHLKDRELADWIGRRIRRLSGGRPRRFGMTEKNRRRLAVFRDREQVKDLLFLPYRLVKRAESGTLPPQQAAMLVRTAVAIELEIMCPVRLQNLAELDADAHFVRSRAGRRAAMHLFIPGSHTKNGEDIELELPRDTVALIDLYLTRYRHHLVRPECRGAGPRLLFPRPDGTAKMGRVLADGICRVLRRELGIDFNIHLFRHLGCYLYLRSHPGQIDVMRRVLGHKDAATTMRFYAFVEQSEAFRLFDSHVLQIRDEFLHPSRRGGASRRGGRR